MPSLRIHTSAQQHKEVFDEWPLELEKKRKCSSFIARRRRCVARTRARALLYRLLFMQYTILFRIRFEKIPRIVDKFVHIPFTNNRVADMEMNMDIFIFELMIHTFIMEITINLK